MTRFEKILIAALSCSALILSAVNILTATSALPDNVIHIKIKTNIFTNKATLIYPNPFSSSTTLFYTPETNENISIKLYSAKGLFMDELFHEKVVEGKLYEFVIHSEEIESGIYYCIIESDKKIIHQRLEIIH